MVTLLSEGEIERVAGLIHDAVEAVGERLAIWNSEWALECSFTDLAQALLEAGWRPPE